MKIIAAILATAVVSASITFVVSSTGRKVVVEERREVRDDKSGQVIAELQKQLRQAKAEAGKVELVRAEVIIPGASTGSPEEVLAWLSKLPMQERRDRKSVV